MCLSPLTVATMCVNFPHTRAYTPQVVLIEVFTSALSKTENKILHPRRLVKNLSLKNKYNFALEIFDVFLKQSS